MKPTIERCCANCFHWRSLQSSGRGQCRAHPPIFGAWPETDWDADCGEFRSYDLARDVRLKLAQARLKPETEAIEL